MCRSFTAAGFAGLALCALIAFAQLVEAQVWRRATDRNIRDMVRRVQLELTVESSAGAIAAMDVSGDGGYLLSVGADRRPRLWDLSAGRQLSPFPALADPPHTVVFTPDKRGFFTVTPASATLWNLTTREVVYHLRSSGAEITAAALSPDGTLIAFGTRDGSVEILRTRNGEAVSVLRDLSASVVDVAFGPTAQFLLSGDTAGNVAVWEISSGASVGNWRLDGPALAVRFAADETEFVALTRSVLSVWKVGSIDPTNRFPLAKPAAGLDRAPGGKGLLVAQEGGGFFHFPLEAGLPPLDLPAHSAGMAGLRYLGSVGRAASAGQDGLVRLWDLKSGTELITLISTTHGWAALHPTGRFDGSDRALRDVKWAADVDVLPIGNFADSYYDPGLLRRVLADDGPLATASGNLKEGILPPPVVRFDEAGMSGSGPGGSLRLSLTVEDKGGGIAEVRVFHNGKSLGAAALVDEKRETDARDRERRRLTYRFQPVSGVNEVTAQAASEEGIFGPLARQEMTVEKPFEKPKLHLLSIGINKYRVESYALNYALPDVESIRRNLEGGLKPIFGDFRLHNVHDEAATRDGILAAFDSLANTPPQDVILIYIASHGDARDGEFYVIPHEFPFPISAEKLTRHAIAFDLLREKIVAMGARRVVLMIDACKSGNAVAALQEELSRRVLRRLGAQVGMHVIAATGREQYAVEIRTLGHGVFTYSVLQALDGGADTDPRDGNLLVSEIAGYVEHWVPRLSSRYTSYQHNPVVFSSGLDFTIRRTVN